MFTNRKPLYGRAILWIALVALPFGYPANGWSINIDSFDQLVQTLATNAAMLSDSNELLNGASVGGERDVKLMQTTPDGTTGVSVNGIDPGFFDYQTSFSAQGMTEITWDGPDGSPALDTDGLMNLNLLADGATAFVLDYGSDHAADFTFTVHSGGNSSTKMVTLGPSGLTQTLIPFNMFAGTADFMDVGAIQLHISSETNDATDVVIDFIGTNGVPNGHSSVPEPGTFALAALAGLLAACAGRRRERKAPD